MGAGASAAALGAAVASTTSSELRELLGVLPDSDRGKLQAALAGAPEEAATAEPTGGFGGTVEVATPWFQEEPFSIVVPPAATVAQLRQLIWDARGVDGFIFAGVATQPLADGEVIHPGGARRYSVVSAEPASDMKMEAHFPEGLLPGAPAIYCDAPQGPVIGWLEGRIAAVDFHPKKVVTVVWEKHVGRRSTSTPFERLSPSQTAPFMLLDRTVYCNSGGFKKLGEDSLGPGGKRNGKEEALAAAAEAEPLNKEELLGALFAREKTRFKDQDPAKMPPAQKATTRAALHDFLGSAAQDSDDMAAALFSRFGGTEAERASLQPLLDACAEDVRNLEVFLRPPGAAAKPVVVCGHRPKKLWQSFATRPTRPGEGDILHVTVEEDTNRDDDETTTVRARSGTFRHAGGGKLECVLTRQLVAERVGYSNKKMFGDTPADMDAKVNIDVKDFVVDMDTDPVQGIQRLGWSSDMNGALKTAMLETPKTLGWSD